MYEHIIFDYFFENAKYLILMIDNQFNLMHSKSNNLTYQNSLILGIQA